MMTTMMMRSTNLEQTSKCLGGNNAEWAAQSAKPIVIIIAIIVIVIIVIVIIIITRPWPAFGRQWPSWIVGR